MSKWHHIYRFMWCFLPRFCNPCYVANKVKRTAQKRGNRWHCYLTNTTGSCEKQKAKRKRILTPRLKRA
jgi:hypothetical protein